MARRKAPRIPDAILDQLLAGADPKTAFEADGLLDELKKALAERALNAEMDHHLAAEEAGNSRNGYGRKTVTPETGRIELSIPRDRQATFDPQLIARYQPLLPRLRRQDRVDVRPRHEHPGDRRAPARALRDRGLARPDQRGDRRGAGGGRRLAGPAAGAGLPDRVLRRPADQGARRGPRPEQSRPHRARRARRRIQGDPRAVAGAERGRQVLVAGHERAQEPRPSRTCSWPWSMA